MTMPEPPRGIPGKVSESLSTSQWQDVDNLGESTGFGPGRIFLGSANGRYVGYGDDRHILTVAGSRAGKGTSMIVPNLLFWRGSAIITDPKGELATITGRCRADGIPGDVPPGKVYALDPFLKVQGHAQQFRASFNPLANVDADSELGHEIAGIIADTLVIQQEGAAMHWTQAARSFLRGLILYVMKTEPPKSKNLIRMREILLDIIGNQSSNDILVRMKHMGGVIGQAGQGLDGKPPAERGSVLSTCEVQTEFLSGTAMKRVLEDSDFDLEDLKRRRMSVYMCLPAGRLGTHGRWFRLIVGLAMDAMERTGPLKNEADRVLFCLDEFAALGYMQSIEKAAGQIAGFGVKLWTILQDLTQLQKDYGDAWETFIGNAGVLTFWGNTDLTTAKHISERLGQFPVLTFSQTHNTGQNITAGSSDPNFNPFSVFTDREPQLGSSNESTVEVNQVNTQRGFQLVPLLSPAEVIQFFERENGNMLAFLPGHHPVIFERCQYFEERHSGFFGGLYDDVRAD